jgi:transposase, IS5 family
MVHKTSDQLGFADAWLGYNQKLNQQLNKIDQLIDWRPLERLLRKIYSSSTGRPSHPVLLMFKSLLLQTWYNLSDYALEETLDDRLSFRRFVSLSAAEKAPDHSAFSRFRDELSKHGIHDQLFAEMNRQLEERGLIVKRGTLIDATVIEGAPKKPPCNEDGSKGESLQDSDAAWTKKGGKFLFGYKAHVGVDQGSELVRKIEMTPANIHDGKMFASVISGDEKWVFADKAYDSWENAKILETKAINNGILCNSARNRPLTEPQKKYNQFLSGIRCSVERIFGTLKRSYRYSRARYIGLRKNKLQLSMMCMAYNLRRMEKLCT